MKKIKIKYRISNEQLSVEILDMNEKYRSRGPLFKYKYHDGTFVINSMDSPELNRGTFYIRGSDENLDYKVAIRIFKNNADRDAYLLTMLAALEEWSNAKD